MPSETEELRLVVNLTDNASAGISRLRAEINQLGSGASGQALDKFQRDTEKVGQSVKGLGREAGATGGLLHGALTLGMRAVGSAIVGVTGAIAYQIATIPQWASELRKAADQAQRLGLNTTQFRDVVSQLQAQGVSAEAATASIAGMTEAIADLSRAGSQLRLDLISKGQGGEEFIDRLLKAQTVAERMNIIREGGENVYQNALRETGSQIEAANRRQLYWNKFHFDAQMANKKNVEEISKQEQVRQKQLEQHAKDYDDLSGRVGRKWEKFLDAVKDPAIGTSGPFYRMLVLAERILDKYTTETVDRNKQDPNEPILGGKSVLDYYLQGPTRAEKRVQKRAEEIQKDVPFLASPISYSPGGGGGYMPTGGNYGSSASDYIKWLAENTKQLARLNDKLDYVTAPGLQPTSGGGFGGMVQKASLGGPAGPPMDFGAGPAPGRGFGVGPPGTGAGAPADGGGPTFRPGVRPGGAAQGGGDGGPPPPMGEGARRAIAGEVDKSGGMYNYFQKTGAAKPTRSQLETLQTPYGKIAVHPQAAADFAGFTNELKESGAPIKRFGSYADRQKRWGGGTSSHAYGAALDIDDQVQLSPAMKKWISENPERWEAIKRKWNIGQPLTDKSGTGGKDPGHVEWKGPHGSKFAKDGETSVGPGTGKGAGQTSATGPTAGGALGAGRGGAVDPAALEGRLTDYIRGSGLEGLVPEDAARYGIKTGSAEEWASLMKGIAERESSYNAGARGDSGASHGLFQLSPQDAVTYGIRKTPFTDKELADPDFNARMAVIIAAKRARAGGIGGREGMAKYWAGRKGYLARGDVAANAKAAAAVGVTTDEAQRTGAPIETDPKAAANWTALNKAMKEAMNPPGFREEAPKPGPGGANIGGSLKSFEGQFESQLEKYGDPTDWPQRGGKPGEFYNPKTGQPQGQPVNYEDWRNQIDRSQAGTAKVEGTGKITVDVNAPKGTNVDASGGGLFKKTEINRQTQMEPARVGPPMDAVSI